MRHVRGYNCAQAVACTYADLVGVDEITLFKACEGLGLVNSTGDLAHPTSKGSTYALSRQMVSQFASDAGATACHDLKGRETGVVLTPCPRCIEIACDLVERTLFSGRDA